MDVAIRVSDATFQWATPDAPHANSDKKRKKGDKQSQRQLVNDGAKPFSIEQLTMDVPRGSLVAIVGPVGSGKSSLLQGVSIGSELADALS